MNGQKEKNYFVDGMAGILERVTDYQIIKTLNKLTEDEFNRLWHNYKGVFSINVIEGIYTLAFMENPSQQYVKCLDKISELPNKDIEDLSQRRNTNFSEIFFNLSNEEILDDISRYPFLFDTAAIRKYKVVYGKNGEIIPEEFSIKYHIAYGVQYLMRMHFEDFKPMIQSFLYYH